MKRAAAIIMVAVMLLWETAAMAGAGAAVDEGALTWYADAVTAVLEAENVPISMAAEKRNDFWTLQACYAADGSGKGTISEALTAKELPADLSFVYDASGDRVGFLFERQDVTEIPGAVEIYADGRRLTGDLHVPPDEVNAQTELLGFWFTLEDVKALLAADYSFMRLESDRGVSFIETNSGDMPVPRFMLMLVRNGAAYARTGSDTYLDKALLLENAHGWDSGMISSSGTGNEARSAAFQSDYEAIDRAAKSAFLLEVYDATDQVIATGSGFVAFDGSTMITNEHVINGAAYVIAYSDQYQSTYKLTQLRAADAEADIAILQFDASAAVQPLQVDSSARILRGQPVTAIGSPQGVLNTVSSGNISNIVYYSEQIPDYIQFTAPISPGSSGGALFNDQGAVIGLCVSYLKEAESMYYAIPIKYVEELYKASRQTDAMDLASYNSLDLAAPELLNAGEGVWISWAEAPGAQRYVVYRRLAGSNSSFTRLYELMETSYLDKTAQTGKVYEYRIGIVTEDATRMTPIATITRGEETAAATPEATAAPAAIRIDTTVAASKGEYTISWTDDGNAPYRITFAPFSFMGETYGDAGISGSSYTTAWMIPGHEYRVTVTNAKGVSAIANVRVPDASPFEDGNLTAGKVGIQIAPRRDEDGPNGPSNPTYVNTLYAEVITVYTRDRGWSFGLYYRFDLPSFKGSRTYLQSVVFRAPNGFEYIWDVGSYEFTYLGSDGWWKWNIMGEEFFQALLDKYNAVPAGQYYVDLYWDGMLVNSRGFQVK